MCIQRFGMGRRRTLPDGVEGATMARRVLFPLSSIPAYVERWMQERTWRYGMELAQYGPDGCSEMGQIRRWQDGS